MIRISTTFLWPSSFFFLIIDVRTHTTNYPRSVWGRGYSRMCVWWCDADHDTQSSHPFYMLPVPKWKMDGGYMALPPSRKICLITQTRTLFIFLTLLVITSNGWTWEVDRLHFNILILKFPPKKLNESFFFFFRGGLDDCSPAFAWLKTMRYVRSAHFSYHNAHVRYIPTEKRKEKKWRLFRRLTFVCCRRNALQTSTGLLLRLCVHASGSCFLAHTRDGSSMCCEAESSSFG